MPEYRFEKVHFRAVRKFRCRVCGKAGRAQRTFMATRNPFNTDPGTGLPRTGPQIVEALRAQAQHWQPDAHPKCTQEQQ